MSALLGNPMVTTAALPFVLGMVMALLARFALPPSSPVLSLVSAALLLFFYWDTLGPPVVPPVAASQKLIYLAFAGIVMGLLPERLLNVPVASKLVAAALAAALLWLGWRRITGGSLDLQMIAALVTGLLAVVGVAMPLSLKASPSPPAEEPFLVPAAVLALCLAGAIISVLGASIVTGQLLGSLAALAGGWCLVQYIAVLRGGTAAGWSKGTEVITIFAAATVLIQVALLAPKANPVALMLSPLPLAVAALMAGPLRGLVPGIRPLRPLVAGLLIAAPAILAILTAMLFAPHGAALGFS